MFIRICSLLLFLINCNNFALCQNIQHVSFSFFVEGKEFNENIEVKFFDNQNNIIEFAQKNDMYVIHSNEPVNILISIDTIDILQINNYRCLLDNCSEIINIPVNWRLRNEIIIVDYCLSNYWKSMFRTAEMENRKLRKIYNQFYDIFSYLQPDSTNGIVSIRAFEKLRANEFFSNNRYQWIETPCFSWSLFSVLSDSVASTGFTTIDCDYVLIPDKGDMYRRYTKDNKCKNLIDKQKFSVYAYIDKNNTIISESLMTEEMLLYYEVIFNITELYARKLRKFIIDSKIKRYNELLSAFYIMSKTKYNQHILQYKKDTSYGNNIHKVVEWNNKILEELNTYSNYAITYLAPGYYCPPRYIGNPKNK